MTAPAPIAESLAVRFRRRAEIRRKIPRPEPDRIADVCEEAAARIEVLDARIEELEGQLRDLQFAYDAVREELERRRDGTG